jgi:hypothetical protein
MANYMVYVGIAIGIAAIAGAVVYGTQQQQAHIPSNVVPAQAAQEGSYSSSSGVGATINKEKWHEDPFGDIAAKVRAQSGQ